ncbi:hypothetical protein NFI96_010830 [Prochilodus magdalenae]|nr:hypothetical protein NFI96_010830 [Prochilodus magdalenae]
MANSKVHTRTTQQHAAENTGYTYSLSSSYSSSALDYEREHRLAPVFDSPRMSRRSLRLNANTTLYREDSLLDSSHNHRVSFSTGGSVHKESKTLKSRRTHHSTSGSGSLLQTPVKNQSNSVLQVHNSSLHSCAASDASLLSSLLDESCIQERTLVDSVWGLDEDGDLKDQTLRVDRSFTSVNNGDMNMAQAQTQTSTIASTYICKDCVAGHSDKRDAVTAYSSSKPCSSSSCSYSSSSTSALHLDARDGASSHYTTVYSREKSRRHKSEEGVMVAGEVNINLIVIVMMHPVCFREKRVLGLISEACLHYSRKAAASVVCVFTLLMQSVLLKTGHQGKALLWSVTDWCASMYRRVVSFSAAALKGQTQSAGLKGATIVNANGGHAGYCGTMNVNELVIQKEHQNLGGPLCKAASGAFWWLGTAWYQLVTLMSLLNVFFLTRCLPILRKILLILLPLLLLLALWFWGLSSFWAILPAANKTATTTDSLLDSPSTQIPMDKPRESQPGIGPSHTSCEQDTTTAAAAHAERLARIEQSLMQLWDRVAASGSKHEKQHEEVLKLYSSLRDQLHTHTNKESMGQWVSTLMEQRVTLLRAEMEKGKVQAQQHQEELEQENHTHESRLAEVEALLKNLALKTEELQRRQETETPSSISGEVDEAAHATLLAEVRRLEESLGSIRTDLQGVMGCKGRCEQLDSLHHTSGLGR